MSTPPRSEKVGSQARNLPRYLGIQVSGCIFESFEDMLFELANCVVSDDTNMSSLSYRILSPETVKLQFLVDPLSLRRKAVWSAQTLSTVHGMVRTQVRSVRSTSSRSLGHMMVSCWAISSPLSVWLALSGVSAAGASAADQ